MAQENYRSGIRVVQLVKTVLVVLGSRVSGVRTGRPCRGKAEFTYISFCFKLLHKGLSMLEYAIRASWSSDRRHVRIIPPGQNSSISDVFWQEFRVVQPTNVLRGCCPCRYSSSVEPVDGHNALLSHVSAKTTLQLAVGDKGQSLTPPLCSRQLDGTIPGTRKSAWSHP